MIDIVHRRLFSNKRETIGLWYLKAGNAEEYLCYILEDEFRTQKLKKETRIPAGRYQFILRTVGSHHERYSKKFPNMHVGMLHLINVPNFSYILFHIGNDEDDTEGCLLSGSYPVEVKGRWTVAQSTRAYKKVYPMIANHLASGTEVWLTITDDKSLHIIEEKEELESE